MIEKDGVIVKLQEALNARGMKQSFISKETKISTKSMSELCRGESLPKLKAALKISKFLNKPVEEIWELKEGKE
jgi:DNA-binding XRE family transcriptional regulator